MHFRQMFTNSSTFTNLYLSRTDIAYIGKLAERGLLKDANEVGRAGKKIFYSKGGGYYQALADFNHVKPQAVRDRFVHHGRVSSN